MAVQGIATTLIDRLFGATTFDRFVREHLFANQMLAVAPSDSFQALAALPELASGQALLEHWPSDVDVTFRTAQGPSASRMTTRAAATAFAESAMLQLDHVEEHIPLVRAVAHELERRMGVGPKSCYVFALISRPSGATFPFHFDYVDGITLQLSGSKQWIMGRPSVENPTNDHVVGRYPMRRELQSYWPEGLATNAPGYRPAIEETVQLQTGGVLFTPAGWWHSVSTTSLTDSFSLLFAFSSQRWIDRLLEVMRGRLLQHAGWRAHAVGSRGGADHPLYRSAHDRAETLLARLQQDLGPICAADLVDQNVAPGTTDEMMEWMKRRFVPRLAREGSFIAQFNLRGDATDFYAAIEDRTLTVACGKHPAPTLRLSLGLEELLAMPSKVTTIQAAEAGRITYEPADINLAGYLGDALFWS